MISNSASQVSIVGGGLAGLCLAILLRRSGQYVTVYEKGYYPRQRVCGEYLSNECKKFLQNLLPEVNFQAFPEIKNVLISSPKGYFIKRMLDIGGFGMSRLFLDQALALQAEKEGVILRQGCTIRQVAFKDKADVPFELHTSEGTFQSKCVIDASGKQSELEAQRQHSKAAINYIGVKYHLQGVFPDDLIALHQFKDGYAGISRIEGGDVCFCYLAKASLLAKSGDKIARLEDEVLCRNPFLKDILTSFIKKGPAKVISQVAFFSKKRVENHILYVGDAAGMIAPLCGNGMSMALQSSAMLSSLVLAFLNGEISRDTMEEKYTQAHVQEFESRLRLGRIFQRLFGQATVSDWVVRLLATWPKLLDALMAQTHGKYF